MPRKARAPKPDEAYEFELYPPRTLSLAKVDLTKHVEAEDAYQTQLEDLQHRLFREQVAHYLQKRRSAIVFEGWDAAGKGGAIKRLTALMDPRGYKVWPIGAPRDAEVRQHYLWRFWTRLPEHGELAVFDRSWYGRVLVERVEDLAKPREWKRAYDEINAFERMLTDDGMRLCKFFLHIDRRTQLKRFRDREGDPLKKYKIGPEDWRNRSRWRAYERAIQDMLDRTHRPDAPWHLVPANDKKFARIAVLRTVLEMFRQTGTDSASGPG